MSDKLKQIKEHLSFIHDRLVWVHDENANVDYIVRLESIIENELDTLPSQELSELEQQFLALAPEFDTDKYEYEWNFTAQKIPDLEYYCFVNRDFVERKEDEKVSCFFSLIRRKKAPVWAVGDGFEVNNEIYMITDIDRHSDWATVWCLTRNMPGCGYKLSEQTRIPNAELLQKAATAQGV